MKWLRGKLWCRMLAVGSIAVLVGVVGCTKRPNEEELAKLEEQKAAARSAEQKLSELKQERRQLENTLEDKKAELAEHERERDDLKEKMEEHEE